MIIDDTNFEIGNKATASVLQLYYHLLDEGGITNDQTIYIDSNDFNGFDFLNFKINENTNVNLDLDEELIKEGAIIYLLCDLNDIICEYDEDFHSQSKTKKIIDVFNGLEQLSIPETELLINQISVREMEFNYSKYNEILQDIYKRYVYGFFKKKLAASHKK